MLAFEFNMFADFYILFLSSTKYLFSKSKINKIQRLYRPGMAIFDTCGSNFPSQIDLSLC